MTVLLVGQPKIGNLAHATPVPMPPFRMLSNILNGLAARFLIAAISVAGLKQLARPFMSMKKPLPMR